MDPNGSERVQTSRKRQMLILLQVFMATVFSYSQKNGRGSSSLGFSH